MPSDKRPILIAVCLGVVLGSASWLVWTLFSQSPLEKAEARLGALPAPPRVVKVEAAPLADRLAGASLFSREKAGPQAQVRLLGLARRGRAGRALVSIDGASVQWLAEGQTAGDVTLVDVQSGAIVIETRDGRAVIALGETGAVSPPEEAPAEP